MHFLNSLLEDSSLAWSIGIIVVYPLLMIALGEAILRLRHRPLLHQTLRAVRNLVMPALAVFILLSQVIRLDGEQTPLRVAQTVLWVLLIHVVLQLANQLLLAREQEENNRAHVPKLLRDLIRFALVALGAAIVLSTVWGADLGGVVAALGVGSIVLGLALQDALGNLFSGLALLIEQPFAVGDWIQVGDDVGKIVEVNWRAVHLITREQELIIVPNSILAGQTLQNFRRPQRLHVEPVDLGFSYDDPPNVVKQVLKETALSTAGVLPEPAPVVQTISYDDSSIGYRVRLFLADYEQVPKVRDDFMSRVWYTAQRNKLNIPFPIRTVYHQPINQPTLEDLVADRVLKLRSLPLFLTLDTDDLELLARNSELRRFGQGEPVLRFEEKQIRMHMLVKGRVDITIPNSQGMNVAIATLDQGNFFGESALLSRQTTTANIRAKDDVEVLLLDTQALLQVLNRNPNILANIDSVIEQRRAGADPSSTARANLTAQGAFQRRNSYNGRGNA